MTGLPLISLIVVFFVGYLLIISEYAVRINKAAVSLIVAVICWAIYFFFGGVPLHEASKVLQKHVADASQIIFFLLGSMTLVELIDSHKGFRFITDFIRTSSKRKMLWTIAIYTFFLSAVLDNLTTAILMIALLRRMIPKFEERILPGCIVVIAANAGGAWTPIGDITTSMLWIDGQITTLAIMKALFLPSLVSLVVPLLIFSYKEKGKISGVLPTENTRGEPGGKAVFFLGVLGLLFVPFFHAWTKLPPFMGMIAVVGALWILTDLFHFKHSEREHLRVPYILTKIDTSSILFFLGVLLSMNALGTAGVLDEIADTLDVYFSTDAGLAVVMGLISAVVDNVPLVAATMEMYPLAEHPTDSPLWHMIAYAAGTGGSILLIGSSAGIALMGMEKLNFFTYVKKASLPILIGFLAGLGCYLLLY